MLETLSFGPRLVGRMGAVRPLCRDQGHEAIVFSVDPDTVSARVAEEGPPQQRGGQDDESDSKRIVHDSFKALSVPK